MPDNVRWICEGCGTNYAEYVNGCPRCWDKKKLKFSVRQPSVPTVSAEDRNEIEIVRDILMWNQTFYAQFHNTEGHCVIEACQMAIGATSVELAKILKPKLEAAYKAGQAAGFREAKELAAQHIERDDHDAISKTWEDYADEIRALHATPAAPEEPRT
jgi:hypothetical protein